MSAMPTRRRAGPDSSPERPGLPGLLRRVVPLLLLVGYGLAFAVAAFGRGAPAFDDHPGQLFRLWHALERSLPAGAWTADWSPDWWGGYPELQFYPPGFLMAGAALRLLGLWRPPVELVYQVLCGLVLLLPGVTTYALMRRVLAGRWLALPPAFLAMTLSNELRGGVEEGLRWGMLTSRLALGLLPLLLLAVRGWIEAGRRPAWLPVAAAGVILSHPAAGPAAAAIIGIAALLALILHPGRRPVREALVATALGVALTAFWTLPFVARRRWVVPLAWGDLGLGTIGHELAGRPVLLGLALAAPLAWVALVLRRRPFDALLAALPVALLAVLVADAGLFARGWSAIEPARLWDGVVLACVWAGGLGLGVLLGRRLPPEARSRAHALVALALVGLAAALPDRGPGRTTLIIWPARGAWPSLPELSRAHDLPRLWQALRGPSDRVLFLTSSLKLDRNPAWYAPHSHVTALAPILAGREIVSGTFTHPAPVAARFYSGQAATPARLETLAERLDGQRLLGEPWERLSPEAFDDFARRLRIGTVVVPTPDARRTRFLGPAYVPGREAAGFTLFERRDRPWPRVERITHRRYRVLVAPTGGVWIPTGIPAYPLWQVKSAKGPLETRADPWGLLEFRIPIDVFEAELVYSEGWLEWGSLLLSVGAAVAWLVWSRRAPLGASRPAPVAATPGRRPAA